MDSRSAWLQMEHLREWRSSETFGADADCDSSSVFIGFSFGAGPWVRRFWGWSAGVSEVPFGRLAPDSFLGGSSECAEGRISWNI